MSINNDPLVDVLGIVGIVAFVAVALVVFWYFVKHTTATISYSKTRDIETWKKTVRKAAARAAVATTILMFVGIESCSAFASLAVLHSKPNPVMVRVALGFGIVASVLTGVYIILHATWQDLVGKVIQWVRDKRS